MFISDKMLGESSKHCEVNCQCSGLITESFKINSGSNGTKRKQEDSVTHNYKLKMVPTTIDFSKSPISPLYTPSKRRILGEIQLPNSPTSLKLKSPLTNSPKTPLYKYSPLQPLISPLVNSNSPLQIKNSPLTHKNSPLSHKNTSLTSRSNRSRISKVMEERMTFKMSSNKENEGPLLSDTFVKLDVEEETRDFMFGRFESTREKVTNWSNTKLDFTDTLHKPKQDLYVPEKDLTTELDDFGALHDLEEEFDNDHFDECTKYEIISTDSPDIISRGRAASTRKVTGRNFIFGAPLAENEASTSFNKPNIAATRMLTFDDDNEFEFQSPAVKKAAKKSLKFNETPTKSLPFNENETPTKSLLLKENVLNPLCHQRSDSSIGSLSSTNSMSQSPLSRTGLYTSESTTSMESGFISEFEEPFLEIDESNSPKVANFNELLSGQIKTTVIAQKSFLKRPTLSRSISFNPESTSRARVSLLSVLENPDRRSNKRVEREEEQVASKRRRGGSPKKERPVLQRALSENNASIMSAMARSALEPELIGDFSVPCALPLTAGHHSDLKSISCDTLAALLRGEYDSTVAEYTVIDCRYPYEFEGGHIAGAVNYYTPAQVLALVGDPLPPPRPDRRRILVFHCEFSLERGPKLCRALRCSDRAHNAARYPRLRHPELYVLHAGYRAFYQQHPALCRPQAYTAMRDPRHRLALRRHRTMH